MSARPFLLDVGERAILLACLQDKIDLVGRVLHSPQMSPPQKADAIRQREAMERLKARLYEDAA